MASISPSATINLGVTSSALDVQYALPSEKLHLFDAASVQLAGSALSLKSTTMRPSGRTTPVTVNCTSVMPVALTVMSLLRAPVVVAAIVMVTSALVPASRLVGAPVMEKIASLDELTLMPSKVAWPVLAMVKVFVVSASMTPKSREAG